jgi:Tol biopolymer transport system component/DNA-binding winged helix-turn-helix (wHTH) protein
MRLSGQPMRILLILLERPGQVVSREELSQQIWGDGTFVDFEGGLNAAINKLRRALSDSAENPRYVETIPGRGYRFIGVLAPVAPVTSAPGIQRSVGLDSTKAAPTFHRQRLLWSVAAAACLTIGLIVIQGSRTARSTPTQWQFTQVTQGGESSDWPALSRDGKLLAYSSEKDGMSDLYVKQITGGQPIRLTYDGAGNTMPDFSPDGSKIVFRSNHDGGGIYEIAAFGGETRLLAREGLNPKYSPDGAKVAFWTGDSTVVATVPGNGTVWVVPSKGGTPVRVGTRLTTARRPIWSPDGRRLLVIGYASDKLWEASSLDWWTISTNGDVNTKTEIRDALLKAGLENPGYDTYSPGNPGNTINLPPPACWLAEGNRIIFSALTGDARNLWSTQISTDGKITGGIQRLTVGSGNETNGSCGSNEALAFARKTSVGDVWSFPFDLESGTPTRPPVQLTHGPSTERESPSISADGQRVAFSQFESSKMSVWVHDLASGKEAKLAPSSFVQRFSLIAPSGDRVAYSSYENDKRFLYVAAPGDVPERLCDGCVRPTDWSRDGKKLLTFEGSPYQVSLLNVASHEQTMLLAHPTYSLLLAHFSPDNRWISFTARVRPDRAWIMIAPIDGPLPVP